MFIPVGALWIIGALIFILVMFLIGAFRAAKEIDQDRLSLVWSDAQYKVFFDEIQTSIANETGAVHTDKIKLASEVDKILDKLEDLREFKKHVLELRGVKDQLKEVNDLSDYLRLIRA